MGLVMRKTGWKSVPGRGGKAHTKDLGQKRTSNFEEPKEAGMVGVQRARKKMAQSEMGQVSKAQISQGFVGHEKEFRFYSGNSPGAAE